MAGQERRVGVIGTFVWDEIHGRDPSQAPIEEWGGITYALAGMDAALSDEWKIVPLIKVGSDLAQRAQEYLRTLRHLAPDAAAIEVPYRNNRVVLRYTSAERRSEQLSGGIPAWHWLGLKPLLSGLDALYVNLVSGFELTLEVAQLIRQTFTGPIYCDIHALVLAVNAEGYRVPQRIPDIAAWLACFDLVQMNEDEVNLVASDGMAARRDRAGAGSLGAQHHARAARRGVLRVARLRTSVRSEASAATCCWGSRRGDPDRARGGGGGPRAGARRPHRVRRCLGRYLFRPHARR